MLAKLETHHQQGIHSIHSYPRPPFCLRIRSDSLLVLFPRLFFLSATPPLFAANTDTSSSSQDTSIITATASIATRTSDPAGLLLAILETPRSLAVAPLSSHHSRFPKCRLPAKPSTSMPCSTFLPVMAATIRRRCRPRQRQSPLSPAQSQPPSALPACPQRPRH